MLKKRTILSKNTSTFQIILYHVYVYLKYKFIDFYKKYKNDVKTLKFLYHLFIETDYFYLLLIIFHDCFTTKII